MQLIEHLAGEIGVRFAGTAAEERGAHYILEQFQALGLKARLEPFQFLGWELLEQPSLRLLGPVSESIPCFAFIYSPSTPSGGYNLPIQKVGVAEVLRGIDAAKYALVDPVSGRQCAHIITRRDGPGASMPLEDPSLAIPTVMVGGDEALAFERLVAEHPDLQVHLSIESGLRPDAVSHNVVATLPGRESTSVVLVTAHHDTEYNSPGAVDNASGVEAVVALARRLVRQDTAKTVEFTVFGGEEFMLLGAKYHARTLKESGALHRVEAIVNLDMIACNAPNWINVTQDEKEFKVRVARAFERFGVFERYGDVRWELPPWPTSDHAPFTQLGIPTLFISYEGQRYPHWHLPSDTVDKVDIGLLDLTIDFTHAIVADLVRAA